MLAIAAGTNMGPNVPPAAGAAETAPTALAAAAAVVLAAAAATPLHAPAGSTRPPSVASAQLWSFGQALRWLWMHGVKTI